MVRARKAKEVMMMAPKKGKEGDSGNGKKGNYDNDYGKGKDTKEVPTIMTQERESKGGNSGKGKKVND